MIILWVFMGLLALIVLLCLLRVGALADYDGAQCTLDLLIAGFRLRVLPAKPKKEKTEKKAEKEREEPKETPPKAKMPLRDVLDLVKTLLPAIRRALSRTRRGVRIDPLDASVILAGVNEPADAAQLYGEVQALIWTLMPCAERYLVIPRPHIHTDVDYTAEKTRITLRVGLTARVGTLLMIGLTLAIPALRWYLDYRKKTKEREDDTDGKGKQESAA